jgi:hypothetical protein
LKNVLVLYYTQTGQLKDIIDSYITPFEKSDVTIFYEKIVTKKDFGFPWKIIPFFDAFAESVKNIPCEIQPLKYDDTKKYDLVILAYQIWYLNPSIPFNSALLTEKLTKTIKGSKVITIIGCRNLWIMAQEKVKKRITDYGGQLVGNIALVDRTSNVAGAFTIVYWLIFGKKDKLLGIFPLPGVSEKDIKEASNFGNTTLSSLINDDWEGHNEKLIAQHSAEINPSLLIFEKRISRIFQIWANFIFKSGPSGSPKRKPKLIFFIVYLIIAILVLAPISAVVSSFYVLLNKKKLKAEIGYYQNVNIEHEN